MVIDTSALFAILAGEDEGTAFAEAIACTPTCLLSSVSLVEIYIVMLKRSGPSAGQVLADLLHGSGVRIEAFDAKQAVLAQQAAEKFGKGRQHPAGLNFGDCCTYALAKATGYPILFKGNDFIHTDLVQVEV